MRTARSSSRPGGFPVETPRTRHPPEQTPQTRHPPGPGTPLGDQAPPGTWHLPARHAGIAPPCEQNDRQVKNITLPQTSFAGGINQDKIRWNEAFWELHRRNLVAHGQCRGVGDGGG